MHVKSSPPIPVLSQHGQEGREGSWGSRTCAPSPLGGTQEVEAPPGSLAPREHPGGHLLGLPPPLWACPSAPLPTQPPHHNPSSVPWCLWLKPHHQGRGGQPRVHPTTTPPRARQLPPVAVLSAGQVSPRPRSKAWLPGLWQQRAARLRKASHHILPGDLAWVFALTLLGSAAGRHSALRTLEPALPRTPLIACPSLSPAQGGRALALDPTLSLQLPLPPRRPVTGPRT